MFVDVFSPFDKCVDHLVFRHDRDVSTLHEKVTAFVARGNAKVGLASFTWTIHHAPHDGDLQGQFPIGECSLCPVGDIDDIDLGTTAMLVVATPGHSGDSVCVTVPSDGSVLTGDTVLGRGTTLVAWPDGTLRDYLDSLGRLRDLAVDLGLVRILPGHGPVLGDPVGVIDAYLSHRRERLAQVREVYESGITSPEAIVEVVYADVPREVWPAAEQTVRAQVDYLRSVR